MLRSIRAFGLCAFLSLWAVPALALDANASTPSPVAAFNPCAQDKTGYIPIAQRSAHTVFFRIKRCGQPESYLFGSIHSDDAAVTGQAVSALAIIPNIAAAGFEYLEPDDADTLVAHTMFDPRPNFKISESLSATQWSGLRDRLMKKRGMAEATIQRLKPWAAAVMVQIPDSRKGGRILDDMLKNRAHVQNIRLFGLETMEDQLSIFDHMPDERQWVMLKDTLTNLSSVDLTNAKLLQAYAQGDLGQIERLGSEGFAEIKDESLRRYLQEALITKRNARMAERMQLEMNGEPVLTVVGALHLPGKEGILQRLERAGYYLFPVERPAPAPRSAVAKPEAAQGQ